jgi:hypothetical protein
MNPAIPTEEQKGSGEEFAAKKYAIRNGVRWCTIRNMSVVGVPEVRR